MAARGFHTPRAVLFPHVNSEVTIITWLVILSIWVVLMSAAVVGMAFRINEQHDMLVTCGAELLALKNKVS